MRDHPEHARATFSGMGILDRFRRRPASPEPLPLPAAQPAPPVAPSQPFAPAQPVQPTRPVARTHPPEPQRAATPIPKPQTPPGAHLAEGGSVSVSNEEHYQEALNTARGTAPNGTETIATLVVNRAGNPWAKKATGPILEVQLGGNTVGFLTPAMTARYLPFAESAARDDRPLTAKAWVADGSGKGGRDVEIVLNAMPMWKGQSSVAGLDLETTPDFVFLRRTGRAHLIGSAVDGGWTSQCGERLSEADAFLVLKTKPWVGRVLADGSLFEDSPWWCGRCIPDNGDGPLDGGGRFGEQTDITGEYRFSSDMNPKAVREALATRLVFDVAGESYRPGYPENLLTLAETLRTMDGKEWLAAVLRRDSSNEHDRNAIEVHVPAGSGHCGFVPGQLAKILAPMLDGGTVVTAHAVEVRIHGDSPDRPGLTVALSLATPAS